MESHLAPANTINLDLDLQERVTDAITATLRPFDETTEDSRCYFPSCRADKSFRYGDLVYHTGMLVVPSSTPV